MTQKDKAVRFIELLLQLQQNTPVCKECSFFRREALMIDGVCHYREKGDAQNKTRFVSCKGGCVHFLNKAFIEVLIRGQKKLTPQLDEEIVKKITDEILDALARENRIGVRLLREELAREFDVLEAQVQKVFLLLAEQKLVQLYFQPVGLPRAKYMICSYGQEPTTYEKQEIKAQIVAERTKRRREKKRLARK